MLAGAARAAAEAGGHFYFARIQARIAKAAGAAEAADTERAATAAVAQETTAETKTVIICDIILFEDKGLLMLLMLLMLLLLLLQLCAMDITSIKGPLVTTGIVGEAAVG